MKPTAASVTHGPQGPYFSFTRPLRFAGEAFKPSDSEAFAYRWYDKDRPVLGRRMEDQLRFAVCYWHSFVGTGVDPFGDATFARPWQGAGDAMQQALHKADVAFELFQVLDAPFFTFHDRDVAPEGRTLAESNANVRRIAEVFERKMAQTGVRLLWGTANLFSHPRYMAGAATNPDPEVFAYAAAQVRTALEVTHGLGGANYVLWGGREGYETLLNTDLKRELEQMGRFLSMVVEHKHKIGFKGPILIEPKPQEPTKHQYDYDVATVYSLISSLGAQKDVKVNIEQNHAILAGHTFEHEIALAAAWGIFGSIDLNRGDYQSGWDTDQFIVDVPEITLAMLEILKAGGFTTGGMNFDAKIRRQSINPDDLVHAHVGSMDACAKGLLNAAAIIEDGTLGNIVKERYAGWAKAQNKAMLAGKESLAQIAARVDKQGINPQPKSGQQERLENLVNRFC